MKFNWKGKDWYIDGYLASQLDSFVYNIKDDWDFVILITGDRMVRVGKSILGMTVCAYLAWALDKRKLNSEAYTPKCLFFDNREMIEKALEKDKYFINHYDEGREGLAASKAMHQVSRDLIDFFTECGQLNHIFVIIAPDFFELKEDIAVGRSEALINVYRSAEKRMVNMYGKGKIPVTKFSRGYFEFFARKKKEKLYDKYKTTHKKNYHAIPCNFRGRFTNQYTIDKETYLKMKKDALARFKERHKEDKMPTRKADVIRDKIIMDLHKKKMDGKEIAKELKEKYDFDITNSWVNRIIKHYKQIPLENEV